MKTHGNSMRQCAGLIVLALVTGPACWSADSIAVKSRDGVCQVSAPANWTPGLIGGTAESPDKKVSLAVSSPKMVDSFAELKQTAQSVYKNRKVTKDTAGEFIMEVSRSLRSQMCTGPFLSARASSALLR